MPTILLVDDDPVAQRVLSAQLRKEGHTVVSVRSGEGALQRLRETACDLAILDIGLPQMGGLALLRVLRADPRHATLPIIMLTASGQDQDCLDAAEAGANAFLLKPASSNELIETVSQVLENHRTSGPPAAEGRPWLDARS